GEGRSVAGGRELRTPERRDDLVSATQPLPRHPLPRGDPMTDHPIDTEALRVRAERVYRHGGPANAIESLAANVPEILDRLAAAEHRATRAEAQSAIRGRAVRLYQQRAREAEAWWDRWHSMWRQRGVKHLAAEKRATRAEAERDEWREASVELAASSNQANADLYEAEARIKAVQDLIDQADTAGDWTVTCSRLQWAIAGPGPRALDGDA